MILIDTFVNWYLMYMWFLRNNKQSARSEQAYFERALHYLHNKHSEVAEEETV